MAQSSEFTILRTGGLGPGRALGLLAVLGAAFGVLTFVVGDFVAPVSERQAVRAEGQRPAAACSSVGGGAWLKERRSTPEGERSYSVNVGGATAGGALLSASASSSSTPTAAWSRASRPARAASPTTAPGRWPTPRWRAGRRARSPGSPRVQTQPRSHADLAEHARRRRRGRGGAAAEHHDHGRAVALQRPPERPGAGRAALRDPVLEEGAVPAGLPGDGGAGAALRLPARARRRRQLQGLRRHHAGHQLRAAEQPGRPHRPAARLDTLGRGGHARASSTCCCRWPRSPGWCVTVEAHEPANRPDPLRPRRARPALGRSPSRPWPQRVRAARPGVPVRLAFLEFMAPNLPDAGAELAAAGCTRIEVVPMFLGAGGHVRKDLPAAAGRAARRASRPAA